MVSNKRKQRVLRRWIIGVVALLLAFLAIDYFAYPYGTRIGGRGFNQGENGLWLRYWWYFGQRSDAEAQQLAKRLLDEQIRYAYFHVRYITTDGTLKFHYPKAARKLVTSLHQADPSVKVIAWIYAANEVGVGETVNLASQKVRQVMVGEALWLVTEGGFDGVQWDYEICRNEDPDFISLLRETRAALPKGKWLSTATAMWLPPPFRQWGWSEAYFSKVAATCDDIAVMCYDSCCYLPRMYVWLIGQQAVRVTRAVARGNPRCRVLFGVPTYHRGGRSHHPRAENLRLAIRGVRQGLSNPDAKLSVFAGIAPFADYTTQPEEWRIYQQLWLGG